VGPAIGVPTTTACEVDHQLNAREVSGGEGEGSPSARGCRR
jgi:hypothetical protein